MVYTYKHIYIYIYTYSYIESKYAYVVVMLYYYISAKIVGHISIYIYLHMPELCSAINSGKSPKPGTLLGAHAYKTVFTNKFQYFATTLAISFAK